MKKEIQDLGYEVSQVEDGRVTFIGDAEAICRANIFLRTTERVLLKVGSFHAETFEDLFQGTRAIPWEEYLPKDAKFWVAKASSIKSKLFSPSDIQSIMKKAMVERMKAHYGLEQFPEDGVKHQVRFSLFKDEAMICLDTSGEGLYKRGYRAVGVEAPLRETLAAAMVTLSRFRGRDPFCDPFCGSGTICIEAALIALNRAPGLDRSFDAQRWGFVPSRDWLAAAGEAMDKEFHGKYDIWGGDVDPRAVAIARDNARKAGVEDVVRFEVADMRNFRREDTYGQLVTNPPYGERLLERQEAEALYRDFGHMWERLPDTWRTLVLSSHTEFERTFGHQAKKKRKLYNGMIKCDLFMYGNV